MSKFIYPKEGIYNCCKVYMENSSHNLSEAISNCNLDVPYDFAYKNSLDNLYYVLSDYYKEINNINSKLQQINNNYSLLSSDLIAETKKIESSKIRKRERMIR